MINLNEWYDNFYEANTGGQDAGVLELSKTNVKTAYKHANENIPDLDEVIPDFQSNYKKVQGMAKVGKTQRKDMPVITSRDVKLFQYRLENGHIDVAEPFAPETDSHNPFPLGLTGDRAEKWLNQGLNNGVGEEDKVDIKEKSVLLSTLKPIQKQIYVDKSIGMIYNEKKKITVDSTKVFLTGKTYYITSSDGYIIDGHHRWLTGMLVDPSLKVRILSIDLPIKILLPLMLAYGDAIGNSRNK